MSNSADDFLDSIYNKDKIDAFKATALVNYEHRTLKKIMTMLGIGGKIKELEYATKDLTGKAGINVAQFNEVFQTLPFYLALRQIGYVYQTSVVDLFNKFRSLRIVEEWVNAYEESPKDKPVAMVFDFPGVKGTQLVCHTAREEGSNYNGLKILHTVSKDGLILCIEQLEPFLTEQARNWTPDI
jgi:hypothetical protein